MTTEESLILSRCKDGDKSAFRWVVTTYQQRVFSVALKMLADEEEAKDVVQETFIRAWQEFDSFDLQRTFSTWLYTIATRLCLNRQKQARAVRSSPLDELNAQGRTETWTNSMRRYTMLTASYRFSQKPKKK
ncbi:MAG: sigma-70 family RNA polymerase sigma factor [Prevotella sp.]|nr:sigma-70 family RNA polymerase sigma factor [Prevotella sp.]